MTRFGLDSTSEVPAWAHHAVGSTVALRYLSRSDWKVVTRAEYEHYRAAGIDLVLVFEDMGRPDLSDYAGGKADAEFALKQAVGILGTPPALAPVIRFAADADVDPAATDAYYDGVASVMTRERSGPYGSYRVCAHAASRGFKALWQTYAWSAGQFFLGAQVYQYANGHTAGGVGVDYDHVYGEDFGQWDRATPGPADPHHYARFDKTVRRLGGRDLAELGTVLDYDRLRAHPLLHRGRLSQLRSDLSLLADRVYAVAHEDTTTVWGVPTPPAWSPFHRGWRYQQLIHRAQGQKLA